MPSLRISVVTYEPDPDVVGRTLASLCASTSAARRAGLLAAGELVLVDNGPSAAARDSLERLTRDAVAHDALPTRILSGHGNVGYGAGHNLAIALAPGHDFHLVLNPDVILTEDAIVQAIRFMDEHPDVGLLSPRVVDDQGRLQYLCKRYPTPLVLALRGFAPQWLRTAFAARLARYEMRDAIDAGQVVMDVPIATGAFMFCRTSALQRAGGFDPAFFLYFEDFDLSLRMAAVARTAYVPSVRIVHLGGHSARKGAAHVRMFARSALRFFAKHGWRRPDLA